VNYFVIASAKVAPFSAFANFKTHFFNLFLTFNPNLLEWWFLELKVFSFILTPKESNPEKFAKTAVLLNPLLKNYKNSGCFFTIRSKETP
jgi:hypothetical protein